MLQGGKDDTYAWIGRRQRTVQGFETKYTKADVDRIVDDASGTMVKAFCQRMYEVYGDQRCRRKFTKTRGVKVNIGERCKPQPCGKPGHLRVDSVHQGDMDGKKRRLSHQCRG